MKLIKKIYTTVCLLTCLYWVGCLEVEETTAFKTGETGDYAFSIDMGKMIAQLKMFGGADQLGNLQLKDTTAYFKDVLANDTVLNNVERAALMKGYMQMKANPDVEMMKVTMAAPFSSIAELNVMRNALLKLLANSKAAAVPALWGVMSGDGGLGVLDLNKVGFTLKAEKGSITHSLTSPDLLQETLNDSMMQQLKMLAPLMGSPVTFKNVYQFSGGIKSFKGENGKLSDDRKSVIITNDINALFDNPRSFEYSIVY